MTAAAEPAARAPSRLSRLARNHGRLAPALLYLAVFFVLPVSMLLGLSVLDDQGGFTFEHYQRLWDTPVYGKVLVITAPQVGAQECRS